MSHSGESIADVELVRLLSAELGVSLPDERLAPLAAELEQHLRRADRLRELVQPEDEPGFLDLRH